MTSVFDSLLIRNLEIPNRLWMSPMCMYSAAPDGNLMGAPTDFHLAHYAARAAGGAGLVMLEATGVSPEGRISPWDLGLWNSTQAEGFARVAAAITAGGAVPGVQLAHAGRKASSDQPWKGGKPVDASNFGWQSRGASPVGFPGYPVPEELSLTDIADIVANFAAAAERALAAGFKVIEIHAAHGYLLHSFLSPLSNKRTDAYGGDFAGRSKIVLEVIDAIRAVWPSELPLFMRVSTTDWVAENPAIDDPSWTIEDTIALVRLAGLHGVDLIDASSGGNVRVKIPLDRDYQTRYAKVLRENVEILVAAVGRVTDGEWAEELVSEGQADAVFVGRAMLRDPSFANNAAAQLGAKPDFMQQYSYAL